MITTLEIENFRCFKSLKLEHLGQINIIVGKNGSGKTALIEALVIALSEPERMLQIREFRAGANIGTVTSKDLNKGLWRHFFYAMQENNTINIKTSGSEISDTSEISFRYEIPTETKISLPMAGNPIIGNIEDQLLPLIFSQTIGKNTPIDYRITCNGNQINFAKPPVQNLRKEILFYSANTKYNPIEAANRFSILSQKNEANKIINPIKKLYPFIQDLSIEVELGQPTIFASLEGMTQKVSLQYVSEGIYKLSCILLGMVNYPNGVIVIDEIENGLYHETFDEVWHILFELAKENNIQLFITTHSYECLVSAAKIAENNEEKFALLRTKMETSEVEINRFNGLSFRMAIEQHGEVR